jgi:hemerythrin-like domain-containing protein
MNRVNAMNRRHFVAGAGTAGVGMFLGGHMAASAAEPQMQTSEVTPAEDLMFEHGVIDRLLLIYEQLCDRIDAGSQVSAVLLFNAANTVRSFVEYYHEKLEEEHVFPRLREADRYVDIVNTLQEQHRAAHDITALLLENTTGGTLTQPDRTALVMRSYIRMYRPHIAWENSVVFRTFHDLVPAGQYRELGERFEDTEHERFGADGFEETVERVADIEKQLGINDLTKFTSHIKA